MGQGKRGQTLELMIDHTNEIYKIKGMALIDKVPTPMKTYRGKTFYSKKSTVDFVGVSHGRSIAFDAKSTNNNTSFPLKNIEQHQVDYLLNHMDQGGISFLIIAFAKLNEVYYVPISMIEEWWVSAAQGGRKSIPHEWFMLHCDLIKSGRGVILDYLKCCLHK